MTWFVTPASRFLRHQHLRQMGDANPQAFDRSALAIRCWDTQCIGENDRVQHPAKVWTNGLQIILKSKTWYHADFWSISVPVIFIVNTLLTARLIHTVSQSPCVLSQVVKQITSISIEFGDPGYRGYRGRGNGPVFWCSLAKAWS